MDLFLSLGFWLTLVVIGAFDVIGLIEGAKSVIDSYKKMTKLWIATVASLVLSYVVAFFIGTLPNAPIFGSQLHVILFGGTTIFAFIEIIGYNMIVKTGYTLFDSVTAWAEKKIAARSDANATMEAPLPGSTGSGQ